MNGRNRTAMLLVTVIMVFALSAMWTVPVLAEDGAPPPPPTEESTTESTATEEAAPQGEDPLKPEPTDASPVTEPAPTESPITEEPQIAVDPETSIDEATTKVLEQLPAGTELVVLDATGQPLPLASADAAAIVAEGDPVWCPAGVTPGGGGCSGSYASLSLLVASWDPPAANGVIWILGGADPGTAVTIDGWAFNWADASGYSLTLKGGWTGTGGTIDKTNPSVFDTSITITNWLGAVTVSDIEFTGVAGPGSTALTIDTENAVTLTNVNIHDNAGYGAYIYNGFGDVKITTSQFNNNNNGDGLVVDSWGNITLTDVDAIGNYDDGVFLINYAGGNPLTKNITLAGASVFADNGGDGIEAYSNGLITASNLIANFNGDWGAYLDNTGASTAKAVSLKGTNEFKYNGSGGLWIWATGAITTNNISAYSNVSDDGVALWNDSGFSANVTMTGMNFLNNNGDDGLEIYSQGAVLLNNIVADQNGNGGAYIDTTAASTPKSITLLGVNSFQSNVGHGLEIASSGAVTLNKVTADYNGGYGAYIDNEWSTTAPTNISVLGYGEFSDNYMSGLEVYSYGTITLYNITADWNGCDLYTCPLDGDGHGVYLDNYDSSVAPKAVTIFGNNSFSDNYDDGLDVISKGAITLNNVVADGNGQYGAFMDNAWTGTTAGVTVNNTLTYWPSFSDNGWNGLLIYSNGSVTLKDLDAAGNGGYGVYIDNDSGLGNVSLGTLRVGWYNYLGDNSLDGIKVLTNGTITLTNITASGNLGKGANLQNWTATSPKAVTLKGENEFSLNGGEGLYILTKGAIAASNVQADDNGSTGAYLDNHTYGNPAAPSAVTLTGWSNFDSNTQSGLFVVSYGAISVKELDASYNGNYGASLDNAWTGAVGGVTIAAPLGNFNSFWYNGLDGLQILSNGAVTVNSLSTSANGGSGAWIDNTSGDPSLPKNVTISGTNYFYNNGEDGLHVESYGIIAVNNLDAYANGYALADPYGYGAYLDNNDGTLPKGITITGTNTFDSNQLDGLHAVSLGPIKLDNASATDNGQTGVSLNNRFTGAVGGVTITGTGNSFELNTWYGLEVQSLGAVTLSNLAANANGWSGTYILTNTTVLLTGVNTFNDNGGDGLNVAAIGTVTLSAITAELNIGTGLYVYTYGTVTVLRGALHDNGSYGWYIDAAPGTTILKGVYGLLNGSGNWNSTPQIITRT